DLRMGKPKKVYVADRMCDLKKSPAPRWDLINMNDYVCMSIQVSRGCPFNCEFCNVTALFGHKPRVKSVNQVINELDIIYNKNWRGRIFFVDDNFIGNKRFAKKELLPAIIEWRKGKKGIVFNTQVSINIADDPELLQLMVKAGFDSVFIGIETPVEESLKECNKKQNRARDLIEDIRRIQRAGLEVQAGFIVGFDSDPPDIFQRQVKFIQESGIVTAMVGILQAPAGTKLYERLKKEGRILGSMTGDNVDGSTNIIPKMGMDTLIRGYKYIMQNIYSIENYYRRVKRFLQEFQPNRIYEQINKDRILGFIKANIKLGIFGKERKHYWKTMMWTLFHKPKLFPFVVTFAIYGYHFREICKKNLGLEL
ncbi:MAG: B12-binding domain-containing radical SAM protein, partial [Deltaproteobacteria bacterium]